MTHRTAAQRRRTRRHHRTRSHKSDANAPGAWEIGLIHQGPPVGPDVRATSLDEVMEAVAGLDGDLAWAHVAARILPQFERVRPYHPGMPAHVVTMVPPGLPIGLAIDIGPGLVHVTLPIVEGWSMSVADVAARAMANLCDRAAEVEGAQVVWGDIDHVETGWLQTERGIGATLILVPHELGRILGDGPRLLVAPMRDLLIALPPQEVELATWLFAEIASQDPNHLHPRLFLFDGQAVEVRAMSGPPLGYR